MGALDLMSRQPQQGLAITLEMTRLGLRAGGKRMSAFGAKRTLAVGRRMTAFDPKRTFGVGVFRGSVLRRWMIEQAPLAGFVPHTRA